MAGASLLHTDQFLAGGGEMGQLMRSHDWTNTALGEPSLWPQSLKTTIGLLLHSRFPMFLFWGKDLTCFYNDAYRPSLGKKGKHPAILGMKGSEAWPEIWHIIKPLIDKVLSTGEATWHQDQLIPIYRNGKIEDVYWTFSYSPVSDESDNIAGVFVTCTETTSNVFTLRKLEETENQLRNTLVQAPVGIAIFKAEKFIADLANETYLQLVDKDEQSFVGKPLFESLPEIKATVEPLFKKVLKSGKPYNGSEFEVLITRQGRAEKAFFNFVYQPLKDEKGKTISIMVVATEVTGQVEAKRVLAESEQQFRNMVMRSPIPMAVLKGPDLIIEIANEQMLSNIWLREEADVIGQKALDVFPELAGQKYPALLKDILATGKPYREKEAYIYIQGPAGIRRFYLDSEYAPLFEADGSVSGIMITVNDVTERIEAIKKAEESEKRLSMAIAATKVGTWEYVPATGLLEWSQECRNIYAIPADVTIDFDLFANHIHPEDRDMVLEEIGRAMEPASGTYDIAFRIIRYGDKGIRWIRSQGIVYFDEKEQPERFIGTVVDITESKLSEETAARMSAIVQSSEDAIISKTLNGIITSWNNAAQRIFGYTAEEMIGESILKLMPPDRVHEEAVIISRLRKGERIEHFETKRLRKDGRLIDFAVTISPIKDASGKILGASKIGRDITGQKITEQELLESEVRLRLATEGTKLATWDLNLQTREIVHSSRLAEIFGHRASSILSHRELLEQVHPDDKEDIKSAFDEALKTGLYNYEARIIKPNNSTCWIRTQGKVIFDDSLRPVRMIGTMKDITDEKKFIADLEDSRLRMNIAIEAAELGTWEIDLRTRDVIYSRRYLEIFGFREDETPSHPDLLKIIHPDDMQKRKEAMQQAFKTGTLDLEMRLLVGKIGLLRWIRVRGKVFYDDRQEPVKMIGTVADITEQKLYESNLRESEEKFRLLADSMPQHIWTSDTFGNFNYFNRSMTEFSGLTMEQLVKSGWLQIVHPDDKEENVKRWVASIATGEPFLFEHRFRRYDGEYRWQLSRAIPQKDSKGNIQMWVGSSTDIDEIKKHEQQKDDFIKIASHELKTPITTVKGYVQLLLKTHGAGENSFLSSSLHTIDKQILKLTKLIADLLDVTKIETGSLNLTKEVFLIADAVNETAKDIGAAHSSHCIVIHQHANPFIFADKDRISQVLSNLFTNAIKYSPKADKIVVNINQEENDVVVSVTDYGIGIAPEDHDKIFDRFFRAAGKDEKTFPGFGIGLFIVNEILSMHKGKVWVKSGKNQGATFYFSLPVYVKQ